MIGEPAPQLRRFVESYVGYHFEGYEPGLHIGMPSRHLTFIVSFDRPVTMCELPDESQEPHSLFTLAAGLAAGPTLIRHDGNEHGVQLEITPEGARALFGAPAAELASIVVPLDDVLGSLAHELEDRLNGVPTWPERFAVLDEVLTRALCDLPPPRDEVRFAWDRLVTTRGGADIGTVAEEVGWSRRHLSERFRREFGQTPKVMGRIMRFERSRSMLTRPDRPSLAQVAATTGYADQAHLTREWRDLAGTTPGAWMEAEEFPFVQDSEAEREAV